MKIVGRLVAAVVSLGFALLAVPYLLLTTAHVLNGGPVAGATILVFVAFLVGMIVVVAFWVRTLRPNR